MYNRRSTHTCDVSILPTLSAVSETIHVESLSQYEPLNITTGDASSQYLNTYDILHDGDGQMEVFTSYEDQYCTKSSGNRQLSASPLNIYEPLKTNIDKRKAANIVSTFIYYNRPFYNFN